jgi:glycerol-3-phosphate acyltransferase PlsY
MPLFENIYVLFFLIILSYLIGSISFGIFVTKVLKLGDLRSIGSGNIGATNVLRTGSKKAAIMTLILDAGKGALVVALMLNYTNPFLASLMGISVFLGHLFPIWQKFKGGKGVATFIGIILVISFKTGILTCLTWLMIAIIFKKSSLSALISILLTPLWLWFFNELYFIIPSSLMVLLMFVKHVDNINRLFKGIEPNIKIN